MKERTSDSRMRRKALANETSIPLMSKVICKAREIDSKHVCEYLCKNRQLYIIFCNLKNSYFESLSPLFHVKWLVFGEGATAVSCCVLWSTPMANNVVLDESANRTR